MYHFGFSLPSLSFSLRSATHWGSALFVIKSDENETKIYHARRPKSTRQLKQGEINEKRKRFDWISASPWRECRDSAFVETLFDTPACFSIPSRRALDN